PVPAEQIVTVEIVVTAVIPAPVIWSPAAAVHGSPVVDSVVVAIVPLNVPRVAHAVTVCVPLLHGLPTVRSAAPFVAIRYVQAALSLPRRRVAACCVPVAATAAL